MAKIIEPGWAWGSLGSGGLGSGGTPCHESHKELGLGGGTVCGGSCRNPRPGYDIYVALDTFAAIPKGGNPWDRAPVIWSQYKIEDRGVPSDVAGFARMVSWLCNRLQEGRRVFIGCMGGHGRTGLVLASIAASLGEKDAIPWVRKHHCKKAVESREQVAFLVKHFGVTQAAPIDKWSDKKYAGVDVTGEVTTVRNLPGAHGGIWKK